MAWQVVEWPIWNLISFHPTCFMTQKPKNLFNLWSVRGEGGKLLLPDALAFMSKLIKGEELRTTDIVCPSDRSWNETPWAFTMFYWIFLHKRPEFIKEHFRQPFITAAWNMVSDMDQRAQYCCAPLRITPSRWRGRQSTHANQTLTTLKCHRETAIRTFNGANRLASTLLLECIVFCNAPPLITFLENRLIPQVTLMLPDWGWSKVTNSDEDVVITHNLATSTNAYVGTYVGNC